MSNMLTCKIQNFQSSRFQHFLNFYTFYTTLAAFRMSFCSRTSYLHLMFRNFLSFWKFVIFCETEKNWKLKASPFHLLLRSQGCFRGMLIYCRTSHSKRNLEYLQAFSNSQHVNRTFSTSGRMLRTTPLPGLMPGMGRSSKLPLCGAKHSSPDGQIWRPDPKSRWICTLTKMSKFDDAKWI